MLLSGSRNVKKGKVLVYGEGRTRLSFQGCSSSSRSFSSGLLCVFLFFFAYFGQSELVYILMLERP